MIWSTIRAAACSSADRHHGLQRSRGSQRAALRRQPSGCHRWGASTPQPGDFRGGLDNRIVLTHLPWLSFTGIQHPYAPANASIPAISTGRSFRQDGNDMLPIAVQAHHALVDGLHVARLLKQLA